jgi:hypothetical protein
MEEKKELSKNPTISCPFCKGRTEWLGEEGSCDEDHHILAWCYACKIAFCVRTGMDVDEWFQELRDSTGDRDTSCESCRKCGETTCGDDPEMTCFEPR